MANCSRLPFRQIDIDRETVFAEEEEEEVEKKCFAVNGGENVRL